MRNVLATDIKNNIRSIRFILGIFLIVSATLMSEHEMLQKIINAGGSAEGPGWFVAYTCKTDIQTPWPDKKRRSGKD